MSEKYHIEHMDATELRAALIEEEKENSLLRSTLSAREAELGRVREAIPTNWLDPLLTGPSAVLGKPPYDCKDIERLLQAVKKRIEQTPEHSP